jgi:hypothetical protein
MTIYSSRSILISILSMQKKTYLRCHLILTSARIDSPSPINNLSSSCNIHRKVLPGSHVMHIVLTSMGKYVESNKATHQKFKKKQTLPRQPRNKMTNTQRKLLLTREKSVCAHTCTGRLGAHNHTENNVLYHDRLSIDSNDDLDIRAIFLMQLYVFMAVPLNIRP